MAYKRLCPPNMACVAELCAHCAAGTDRFFKKRDYLSLEKGKKKAHVDDSATQLPSPSIEQLAREKCLSLAGLMRTRRLVPHHHPNACKAYCDILSSFFGQQPRDCGRTVYLVLSVLRPES